jgi:hypothetical protein
MVEKHKPINKAVVGNIPARSLGMVTMQKDLADFPTFQVHLLPLGQLLLTHGLDGLAQHSPAYSGRIFPRLLHSA